MRTHKHTDLADSSTALIADLNRPGDLSLSLTHTRHTSFFFLLPVLSSSSCPNILCFLPLVALHQFTSTPLFISPRNGRPSFTTVIQVMTSCLVC